MEHARALDSRLYTRFLAIKDSLESSYASRAAQAVLAVGDLIGEAFEYVVSGICAKKVVEPVTDRELGSLIRAKADFLLKDAYRANRRSHGLRSVNASIRLDEPFDGDTRGHSPMDRLTDHAIRNAAEIADRESWAVRHAFESVLGQMGMSVRNRDIARELMLKGRKPEDVARLFGVERNNCDAIAFRVRRALRKIGPELFREYYKAA
ncbi:MAG: hypothetical protein ACI4Q3_06315 [Kiritimatiellia bacterium]